MYKNQHVTPNLNVGWHIKGASYKRTTRIVDTQQEAIAITRNIAENLRIFIVMFDI